MQMFRDVLDHYGFMDLGYLGLDYTWHGHWKGELMAKARLWCCCGRKGGRNRVAT